jgi:CRISPR-associated protein Cmr2
MNNYLAITIGPIYKTMSKARNTRELWSISFTFSYLMKCLIQEFKSFGELQSPSLKVEFPLHGAGVFPDRCFFKLSQPISQNSINDFICKALTKFSELTGYNASELNHFRIYAVQIELESNPIQQLNQMLDALELHQKYSNKRPLDFIDYWQDPRYFQKLYDEGFGKDSILPYIKINYYSGIYNIIRRFKSIPEISTTELELKNGSKYRDALGMQFLDRKKGEINFEHLVRDFKNELEPDQIISKLKSSFKDDFKFRHKYFSIVQADGDNVGSLIKELEKKGGNIMDLSEALNDFVREASDVLVRYRAFPIYMGGDDLLFFAPLTNENFENNGLDFSAEVSGMQAEGESVVRGDHILFILSILNELFKKKLAKIVLEFLPNKQVSLSFGVSIGYYKKPMNEILNESYRLLVEGAKNQPGKNYISVQLEKHSGQAFSFGFNQNTKLYYNFLRLTNESRTKDENFLNSVMFEINSQRELLINVADDMDNLMCFFNENFNESNHLAFKPFFKQVASLINETFKWYAHESNELKMSRIYSSLRFIQFLISKDSHE